MWDNNVGSLEKVKYIKKNESINSKGGACLKRINDKFDQMINVGESIAARQ
jgi:hypothetical protein